MKGIKIALISFLTLVLAFSAEAARTIRVPLNYSTIQQAIDASVNGDTVLVADGTYKGIGNKNLDLKGKAITVKSENGPERTIIDCEASGRGFIFQSGETSISVVSGFTIKNGIPSEMPPGEGLIQIDIDSRTGDKRIVLNANKDVNRPENDGDIAIERGEIIELNIVLKNTSVETLRSVTATIKTDDSRVIGLIPVRSGSAITGWNQVDMETMGISASYGTIFGTSTKTAPFQFVKIDEEFSPLGDQVNFTIDITSSSGVVGSDEFDITVGASIMLDRVEVEPDLVPGGDPDDIDVWVRNVSPNYIENVTLEIDPDESEVDIDEDTEEFDLIGPGDRPRARFRTEVEAGFKGYVTFTLKIRVAGQLINVESFTAYFGMRSQYITYWLEGDDNRNGIAEAGEYIELQIARWNPTAVEAREVLVTLETDDEYIEITGTRDTGDYDDILPYSITRPYGVRLARREYEFSIEDEGSFPDLDEEEGYTVEFKLRVQENDEYMGEETFSMRIGGIIRYLPPEDFDELMGTISDRVSLDPENNNGNGVPEPGETIEIEITLANISEDDADEVEAELDTNDDDVSIIDRKVQYDRIRDDDEESQRFKFRIDDDFVGSKITFEIETDGEIDGDNKNFGKDIFTIPVWGAPVEDSSLLAPQATYALESVATAASITDSESSDSYGGAIYCVNSSPTINGNIIIQNSADFSGGGIYCGDNSSPTIVNNVIVKNSSGTVGGGISCNSTASPKIINNTISGNSAGVEGGGISCRNSSALAVLNTILWGNLPNQIFVDSTSVISVTYSDIQGGWTGDGNISSDPRFVNISSNNYRLNDASPCIATGIMAQNVPVTDLEGTTRPNPLGSNPDMGAYERLLPVSFPTITSISPTSGIQGITSLNITINGRNLLNGATVSFSGSGITVNSVTFMDFTRLIANISISTNAPVEARDVVVTNPDNSKATGNDMFTVTAGDAVIVKVDAAQTVARGEIFSVAINVESVDDLAGYQLDVSFNPAVLEVVGIFEGSFLKNTGGTFWLEPDIDNINGTITGIVSAKTGSGGASGSGTLAEITFRAKGSGQSSIIPQNIRLRNSRANSIPARAQEANVSVTAAPPWDINKDGVVDISDLVIVGQYFGQTITTPRDPNPDVNGDKVVDISDLVMVAQRFGESLLASAPSRDVWKVAPEHLPMLSKMYDMIASNSSSDPAYLEAKQVLQRLIANNRISKTEVFQNYPNPFNPETWIPFQLSEGSDVEVRIYNSLGKLVRILDLGFKQTGYYASRDNSAYWDGRDQNGEEVSSGVYFYTVKAGEYTATRKMLMLK